MGSLVRTSCPPYINQWWPSLEKGGGYLGLRQQKGQLTLVCASRRGSGSLPEEGARSA